MRFQSALFRVKRLFAVFLLSACVFIGNRCCGCIIRRLPPLPFQTREEECKTRLFSHRFGRSKSATTLAFPSSSGASPAMLFISRWCKQHQQNRRRRRYGKRKGWSRKEKERKHLCHHFKGVWCVFRWYAVHCLQHNTRIPLQKGEEMRWYLLGSISGKSHIGKLC